MATPDGLRIAPQHLRVGFVAVAPKPDVESMLPNMEVKHGEIRKPRRQYGIDVQLSTRRVRQKAQYRLQQSEYRAGRPGLRHVGPQILNREALFVPLDGGIELGQLIE